MNMLVTVSGAVIATSIPAGGNGDPIFGAIDAHRHAWAELCANCSSLDEADTQESRREIERLNAAVDEAADTLLDVVPTTLAGVAALLSYAAERASGGNEWPDGYADEESPSRWDREHGVSWEMMLHRSLAKALPTIAA